jgi:prepilin-type N-terminal cleavage/methylation domain-containing protein
MNDRLPGRRGFTLLEMLIALALLGGLMVALNTFLFSMGELWGNGRDQRLFDQHARAATALVRNAFEQATFGPSASGVALKDVDDGAGSTKPRLGFLLADAGRLADWPEAPLPDVDFTVFVEEGRGLVFQWQSRLEIERDKTDKHDTVISPFVTAIHYEYYDAELKEWKVEEEPVNETGGTAWKKPARIHLVFERGALKATKVLNLPIKRSGASTP